MCSAYPICQDAPMNFNTILQHGCMLGIQQAQVSAPHAF